MHEEGKARQGRARQGKARQGKARQGKARQGKARQGKARQGKARQGRVEDGISCEVAFGISQGQRRSTCMVPCQTCGCDDWGSPKNCLMDASVWGMRMKIALSRGVKRVRISDR
jgi:hypothetical protein